MRWKNAVATEHRFKLTASVSKYQYYSVISATTRLLVRQEYRMFIRHSILCELKEKYNHFP